MCLAWLHERGVPIPNIHVEDLASGNAQTGLALCKALHTYDMSRSEGTGNRRGWGGWGGWGEEWGRERGGEGRGEGGYRRVRMGECGEG